MKRLLIVDDAMFMRRLISDVATEAGWEVVGEAADGLLAIEKYATLKPDMVTMDLVMPNLGGLEALKAIRTQHPEAQVIVVSALDQKAAFLDAIGAGAIDFVVKPFDRNLLLGMFKKLGVTPTNPVAESSEVPDGCD